ncbi:helix-turn-helix domain-containing protein [Ensifer aridi]|uniref:helix-turn-helix domain-containing protein n=1 Tax=Ensifer aridi TaxID=1708715 RepID=UPI0023BA35D7|nr:helix-turn-helix transcriptional regulator [Ensifer aridi]
MSGAGDRLEIALNARGIKKQMAFAAQLGVDDSLVSRWLRGNGLSMQNAIRVCEVLDVSLDWLLLGRGTIDSHRHLDQLERYEKLQRAVSGLPHSVVDALVNMAQAIRAELDSDRL